MPRLRPLGDLPGRYFLRYLDDGATPRAGGVPLDQQLPAGYRWGRVGHVVGCTGPAIAVVREADGAEVLVELDASPAAGSPASGLELEPLFAAEAGVEVVEASAACSRPSPVDDPPAVVEQAGEG